MSDVFYIWGARSPSTGYLFHEQNPGQKVVTDRALAQRFADSFAMRLNQKSHMGITDWQPVVEERTFWANNNYIQ